MGRGESVMLGDHVVIITTVSDSDQRPIERVLLKS